VTPFRIIYVEDSLSDAELLKRALLQMLPQADLLHFRDAETAQHFFSETVSRGGAVHLAIIDIKLPGMPGDKLITWLRTQPLFKQLPIIALSGGPAFETLAEAQTIGATSFFVKPVAYNDYIDLVYLIQDSAT
jgi:DNA-binding response OmpR family regulator